MKNSFKFVGSGNVFRPEQEMALIDKEAADRAFKKYKKEILDEFLIKQGFLKWKTGAYVRLNQIGLLEYMDLQKERYGSKTFCVNFAIMPLYCPMDYIVMGLGHRLGGLISGKDFWWDFANDSCAKESFQNIVEAITIYLLPWFEQFHVEENYRKRLADDESKKFIGYPNQDWREALDHPDKASVIQENIDRLKLPKKLGL